MNRKGNRTTTGFIPWEEFQRLMNNIQNEKLKLVAAISTYAGLRISDVLNLKWSQLSGESIVLIEKKTKKTRQIAIHETLRQILDSSKIQKTGYVIKSNGTNKPVSISYVNRKLKDIFDKLDNKIDGLTYPLLHMQQRDQIAVEAENRELRNQIKDHGRNHSR